MIIVLKHLNKWHSHHYQVYVLPCVSIYLRYRTCGSLSNVCGLADKNVFKKKTSYKCYNNFTILQ